MGRALRQLDSWASPAAAFGTELRERRLRAGLTLAELGELVFASGALLGRIEKAMRRPRPELVQRLDERLEACGELIRLASVFLEDADPGLDDFTPETAEDKLRTLVRAVRCDDHTMAADQLHDLARYIKAAEAVAEKASSGQRAGLWRAVAEAQQLTAWITFDHGYPRQAETTLARARSHAERAGALDLVAYIGGPNAAFIHTWTGDPARGAELAYGALAWAQRSGNRRVSAFVATMAARAHAKLNEADLCGQMLSLAETHLDRHQDTTCDPDWLTVFDYTALIGHRGSCLLDLGNARDALGALNEQQSSGPALFVRNNIIWQLERALADLRLGEIEAAVAVVEQALAYVGDGPVTPRVRQVFGKAHHQLSTTAGEAVTSAICERLRGFISDSV